MNGFALTIVDGHRLQQLKAVLLLALTFVVISCVNSDSIVFGPDLLLLYPSDPKVFQKDFGGSISYASADSQSGEKTRLVDKAWVESGEINASFEKHLDTYSLIRVQSRSNKLSLGGKSAVGKPREWVLDVLGKPQKETSQIIWYSDGEFELSIRIDKGVVTRWTLGIQD